jgi:hypothetical protein
MAYENRGVIVIIAKRVLSKPSVKVPEHQRTRASQNRLIQTILQGISGSFFRQKSTSSRPSLWNASGTLNHFYGMDRRFISGVVQLHTRPSQGRSFIRYGAIGWLPSITSTRGLTCSLSPVVAKRRPPGLPEVCPKSSQDSESVLKMNDLTNSSCPIAGA